MRAVKRLALLLAVVLFAGGGWCLLAWDVEPPSRLIEKPLPDVRVPR